MPNITITDGNYIMPSPIENATVLEKLKNGDLYSYFIVPNEGYKLHDINFDDIVYNEEGEPTDNIITGYGLSTTVSSNYDFIENLRKLYTVKDNELNN